MDEFGDAHHLLVVRHLFLDPVFQRLDVVIGHRLDGFDFGRLLGAEIGHQTIQPRYGRWQEGGNLGEMRLGG